jgi:hypothetical protein
MSYSEPENDLESELKGEPAEDQHGRTRHGARHQPHHQHHHLPLLAFNRQKQHVRQPVMEGGIY